mgnify:CR=1 FL=1
MSHLSIIFDRGNEILTSCVHSFLPSATATLHTPFIRIASLDIAKVRQCYDLVFFCYQVMNA